MDIVNDFVLKEYTNDASASSFGWNFQANAALFLFLEYIKRAEWLKVESQRQDIEIKLSDGTYIFAQAKSCQDECSASAAKTKIKDALLSLSKNTLNEGDIILYISNVRSPLPDSTDLFKNKVVLYDEFLKSTKENLEKIKDELVNTTDKKIREADSKRNELMLKKLKEHIEKFDLEHMGICVIYPYYGNGNNRYTVIKLPV